MLNNARTEWPTKHRLLPSASGSVQLPLLPSPRPTTGTVTASRGSRGLRAFKRSSCSWRLHGFTERGLPKRGRAAYYGTHKKGLALNKKRVADALLSFYTVGDCQFDSPGHHGTPLQRERAADWGADLAAAAKPRSYVLPPATFVELFDEALPQIISGS